MRLPDLKGLYITNNHVTAKQTAKIIARKTARPNKPVHVYLHFLPLLCLCIHGPFLGQHGIFAEPAVLISSEFTNSRCTTCQRRKLPLVELLQKIEVFDAVLEQQLLFSLFLCGIPYLVNDQLRQGPRL